MYLEAFRYVLSQPDLALALTGTFVILSQLKINVTNAYAGSIAWSNFFSRLTHSHPGRVVWLVFNVLVALLLMEIGVYKALEQTLALYSNVAIAWVGALVADLVDQQAAGPAPATHGIQARASLRHQSGRRRRHDDRHHRLDRAFYGVFGPTAKALAPFVALIVAFLTAPLIAWATDGKYYIARKPKRSWQNMEAIRCCICEHSFEPEDMASCPAYAGPICSLCCSLDARCQDLCKPHARIQAQVSDTLGKLLPQPIYARINSQLGHYLGVFAVSAGLVGLTLALIYLQTSATSSRRQSAAIGRALEGILRADHHYRRRGVAVRAGAAEPACGGRGNKAADRTPDPGNRRAQAHRRRAAARQGGRRIRPTSPRAATSSASATNCARRSTPSAATRNCWSRTPACLLSRAIRCGWFAAVPTICRG